MKRFFIFAVAAAISLAPISAMAAASGSASGSGSARAGEAGPAQLCLAITKNLGFGMRSPEVASLQTYLLSHSSYTAGATGYFGPLTRAAVIQWQTAHSIPATGFVGPLSRAALTCADDTGGGTSFQVDLKADPSSGAAPLTVAFSAAPKNSGQYIIQFGDGEMSGPIQSHCLSSNASPTEPLTTSCDISTSHTYKKAGTYTAVLEPYVSCMFNTTGPRCMIAVIMLGQTTITVK